MAEANPQFIWRCVKCSSHFANMISLSGNLKLEKKCPKCKALNSLTINNKEINLNCLYPEPSENNFDDEASYQTAFPDA